MPLVALIVVFPPSCAPPGFPASEMVTGLAAPITVASRSSWSRIRIGGVSGAPATAGPGCSANASRVAGRVATETRAEPDLPSAVAVMVTGPPWANPITMPVVVTAAMAGSLEAQSKLRPGSGFPSASNAWGVSWTPAATSTPELAGVTVTRSTGTERTVTSASPTTPSTVARIRTGPPSATPLTMPVLDTVAIRGSLLLQLMPRPGTVIPLAVRGVAANWRLRPWITWVIPGSTSTRETTSTPATPPSPDLQETANRSASSARRVVWNVIKQLPRLQSDAQAGPKHGVSRREIATHLEILGPQISRGPPAELDQHPAASPVAQVGVLGLTGFAAHQLPG